jgi:hypothetical protein
VWRPEVGLAKKARLLPYIHYYYEKRLAEAIERLKTVRFWTSRNGSRIKRDGWQA